MGALRIGTVLLVLCSTLFGLWIVSTSSSFQACISNQTAKNTEAGKEQAPKGPLSFTNEVALKSRCAGHVIYDYRDATIAAATVLIAVFTFTLWWTTGGLLRLTRAEFLATHRPRVIVRFIEAPTYDDEPREIVRVHVVNIGVNTATIYGFGGDLARRNIETRIWTPSGASGAITIIEPIRLESAARHVFVVRNRQAFQEVDILEDAWNRAEICVFGSILYRDDGDVTRETGFFRIFDRKSEKFIPSKDQGEEYED